LKGRTMDASQLAIQAQNHIEAGRLEEAAEIYRSILSASPTDADMHHVLGLVYAEMSQWTNARGAIETAIQHNPLKALFQRSLGDICRSAGDVPTALSAYEQALRLSPDDADTLLNLGNLLHAGDDLQGSMNCFAKILVTQPGNFQALNNMGKSFYDQGDIDSAIKYYNESLEHAPDYAEAHFNRAVALLLKGEFLQGWKEYEWRFKRDNAQRVYPHTLRGLRWNGSPFGGERLLVHCEQGFGDVLHFCRYLPMVKALGGTVIVEIQKQLAPLLKTMPAIDEIALFDPHTPPSTRYDRYIPLLSLPMLMKTTFEKLPAHIPYLQADTELTVAWRGRLPAGGLRVGLVWSGSDTDPQRACRLADWHSWWRHGPIRFFSLQKGPAAEQTNMLGDSQAMVHLGAELADFSDTAAVIAHLDLVITVDTAVAHLAGAMGKPVWVLLPLVADWRWLQKRSDSPWYPTARLFRQSRRNDWSQVIQEVGAALETLVGTTVEEASSQASRVATVDARVQGVLEEGRRKADGGDLDGAVTAFQQALSAHPGWAEAHFELGRAYHNQGRLSQAIAAYRAACRIQPEMQPAYANLGLAFYQNGDLEQAAMVYEQAIGLHRNLASIFTNLGAVREDQRNFEEAKACYQCALRIDPAHADAHYKLGNLHLAHHELEQALTCYTQALQNAPRHVKTLGNMGRAYHLMGLLDAALDCYDQAIALTPDHPEVHLNRAVARLLVGEWEAGWSDYEWRFQCRDWKRKYPHRLYGQRWQGEPFKGQTLLVHCEQAMGDAIQFARYLKLAKARGGRVIFEVPRSLSALFAALEGVDERIELSAEKPPCVHYHYYVPLGSLPSIFKTSLTSVPDETPYLKADATKAAAWENRLPAEGLNVGLVWGENETYKERSCTLADMSPLGFVKGINWIGLQKGPAATQATPERLPRHFNVVNWGEEFEDFSDTAAAVECLDLIISIDTSVAHLAGAMGKPVWILLPAVPDWRWLLERSRTPWYPSAHLFRQSRDGNWSRVIAHMSASLERWRKDNRNL
jgi:tetratricopeptide (TPR) repeat protein